MFRLLTRLTVSAVFTALMLAPVSAPAHPTTDIVASNWKFTPAVITVHVNEPTTLRLTSSEGVHGIASEGLRISKTTLLPDKFSIVHFTPKKVGSYEVKCAVICGAGHDKMVLTIKVVR
ncbi:MAG: cupredoxin domain-containing protein [Candidatus Eremiobacteraeota bacterium]|nr:cupredoxin domain-containing protein [Candidatus Eremiobacteraeota bacterium]